MSEKDGYVFVYALDDADSLKALDPFLALHKTINGDNFFPIILVATKKDLIDEDASKRQVSRAEGLAIAEKYHTRYMETSSFTGENVQEIFTTFIRDSRIFKDPEVKHDKKCVIM